MERLQPRYLEAFAPAICAIFGISVSVSGAPVADRRLAERHSAYLVDPVGSACVLAALLAASLRKDAYEIRRAHTDSLLTDFSTPALSQYLRAHRDGTRYEVAGANINDIVGLVARDDYRFSSSTALTDPSPEVRSYGHNRGGPCAILLRRAPHLPHRTPLPRQPDLGLCP